MKAFLRLQSVDEVLKLIYGLPILDSISVPLNQAIGKSLAESFYAPADLPGFARSTMDGFAVRARDVFGASENSPALLRIRGSCEMGKMPDFDLNVGETAIIQTGAPLPQGADAVVMVEHSRGAGNNLVELAKSVAPGLHIVAKDEDAATGQELICASKELRPQEIGILAAFGQSTVQVTRPARVAIFSTGDELTDIDTCPDAGKLRDVNSWSLDTLCQLQGSQTRRYGIVPDEPHALREALLKAMPEADVIVVSGGSSAGMRDHTVETFTSLPDARLLVHGVAISPGKPFIMAQAAHCCLLGLPGHVTSALLCGHVFLAPLLKHLQGQLEPERKAYFMAKLARNVASAQGRRDYIRCQLEQEGDELIANPLLSPSALLLGLVRADGYIICPENSEGLLAGQQVRVYPI